LIEQRNKVKEKIRKSYILVGAIAAIKAAENLSSMKTRKKVALRKVS